VGAGSAGLLVILAVALIDLDDGLGYGIVVAPVGAHAGAAGVAGHDAVILLQIFVEHLGVGGVAGVVIGGFGKARQRADAALGEDHVAMAFGIGDAALVHEHGDELALVVENIGELLGDPPGIFPAAAVVV